MAIAEWLRNNWLGAIVVSCAVWLLPIGTGLSTSVALIQKDVTNIDKTLTEMKQTLSDIQEIRGDLKEVLRRLPANP